MPRTRSQSAHMPDFKSSGQDLRSANPRIRAMKGELKHLIDLPHSILSEILSVLHPSDLLQVSRTSKAFRELLTRRDNAFIWKASFKDVQGLPPCPHHLNEVQYANLAFSPHCHECLAPNISTVLWEFGTRYCDDCKAAMTITCAADARLPGAPELSVDWVIGVVQRGTNEVICRVSDIEYIRGVWETVKANRAVMSRFAFEHRAHIHTIIEWADECRAWEECCAAAAKSLPSNIAARIDERLQSVVQRLRELREFDKELEFMKPGRYAALLNDPAVNKPSRLTDWGWECMRERVVQIMHQQRATRLRAERKLVLTQRYHALKHFVKTWRGLGPTTPASELLPKAIDFAMMPELIPIMDAPSHKTVSVYSFENSGINLPKLQQRWEEGIKERLQPFLSDTESAEDEEMLLPPEDMLTLATAVFACRFCEPGKRLLWWPNLKAHPCLRKCGQPQSEYEQSMIEIAGVHPIRIEDGLSKDILKASYLARLQAKSVITSIGLNPARATAVDVDELNPRILCAACTRQGETFAFTWRGAMEHIYSEISKTHRSGRIWYTPAVEERDMIIRCQSSVSDPQDHPDWCCAFCDHEDGRGLNMGSIKQHMMLKHGFWMSDQKKGDVYRNPGTAKPERMPLLIQAVPSGTEAHCDQQSTHFRKVLEPALLPMVEHILADSAKGNDVDNWRFHVYLELAG